VGQEAEAEEPAEAPVDPDVRHEDEQDDHDGLHDDRGDPPVRDGEPEVDPGDRREQQGAGRLVPGLPHRDQRHPAQQTDQRPDEQWSTVHPRAHAARR
jgi:hypothetical protein